MTVNHDVVGSSPTAGVLDKRKRKSKIASLSLESCPSGRRSTIGNRVGVKSVSRVQIPDSPPVNSKAGLRACFVFTPRGGVAEWLNAAVSKTVWPV